MKCPFLTNTINEYGKVNDNTYLLSGTREEFADCCGDECPYFEYPQSCMRISEED